MQLLFFEAMSMTIVWNKSIQIVPGRTKGSFLSWFEDGWMRTNIKSKTLDPLICRLYSWNDGMIFIPFQHIAKEQASTQTRCWRGTVMAKTRWASLTLLSRSMVRLSNRSARWRLRIALSSSNECVCEPKLLSIHHWVKNPITPMMGQIQPPKKVTTLRIQWVSSESFFRA